MALAAEHDLRARSGSAKCSAAGAGRAAHQRLDAHAILPAQHLDQATADKAAAAGDECRFAFQVHAATVTGTSQGKLNGLASA